MWFLGALPSLSVVVDALLAVSSLLLSHESGVPCFSSSAVVIVQPDGSQNYEYMFHVFFLHRRVGSSLGAAVTSDDLDDWQLIGHSRDGPGGSKVVVRDSASEESPCSELPFLYCLTLVHCHKDNSRRGATIRALVLCTEHPFYMVCGYVLIVGRTPLGLSLLSCSGSEWASCSFGFFW
jgi:hypothetical protein